MAVLANLARMVASGGGTGALTLTAAAPSFFTFAQAGVPNGAVVSYAILNGSNREVGRGVYSSTGPTLTRSTVLLSSNANTAINVSGAAEVIITAIAEDFIDMANLMSPSGGLRNAIINGDMEYWQRGSSFTSSSAFYSADRWFCAPGSGGVSCTVSRVVASVGGPGLFKGVQRLYWTRDMAGTGASQIIQRIEGVDTFHGETVTLTFDAYATENLNLDVNLSQFFGSNGSPSASVSTAVQTVALTTTGTRYRLKFDLPLIDGKTLGTAGNDFVQTIFSRSVANGGSNGSGVGIGHVSLVKGDATGEYDPFGKRPKALESLLCLRYYERAQHSVSGYASAASAQTTGNNQFKVIKRAVPTVSIDNSIQATNVTAIAVDNPNFYSFRSVITASSAGSMFSQGNWFADAEL